MFLHKRYNGYWYLYFDADGKQQKVSTHTKHKPEALEFVRTFKQSEHQKKTDAQLKSLSQFQQEFIEYSKSVHTDKTRKTFDVAFNEFIRITGDLQLSAIDVKCIEKFLAQKTIDASQWTARKYYGSLASAFETAIRWKYLDMNPFRQVKKPRGNEILPIFFSKDQLDTLFKTITEPMLRNICIVAACTGMRLGEIVALRWESVDLERRVITVENTDSFTTKSKKHRAIPMNDFVYDSLASLTATQCVDMVFHDSRGSSFDPNEVSRDFKKFVRQLGYNDKLHFHSLRHSFCSILAKAGVSLYTISKLAGHADVRTTQIYAHLSPNELHDTVNKLNF